jgi:hypothetical protein
MDIVIQKNKKKIYIYINGSVYSTLIKMVKFIR